MYKVIKSFATKDFTGTKGKTMKIADKKLAKSLVEAGYIIVFSKDEIKSEKKDEEIIGLKSIISNLENAVETLEKEKKELLSKLEVYEEVGKNQNENEESDDDQNDSEKSQKPIKE